MTQVLRNMEIRLSADAKLTTELFISRHPFLTFFVYILLPLHKLLGAAGTFDVVVNIMVDLVL